MKEKIKAMIVDDSAVVREALTAILESDPDIKVIATAQDPIFAAKKMETVEPDVMVLDVEMPRMDGLSFLRKLMASRPLPVVICSSKVEAGSENALRALEFGAVDLILKPKIGAKQFLEESKIYICDAVKAAYYARFKVRPQHHHPPAVKIPPPKLTADAMLNKIGPYEEVTETTEKIVAVGASTGGTEALRVFLEMFPANGPGMVIVQHMPEYFTASFADRLNSLCRMTVKEAKDGDVVARGQALIAPGNKHTLLKRSGLEYYVEVKDGPLVTRHRPSVDVLFRSAARYAGKNAIGVIMTGMGDDGARGMLEMKRMGAYGIAQNEETCVVFGMPAEAIALGGIDSVLPLDKLADEVLRVSR